ncbi:unnamed protein product [Parnassius apollo]|uniref:(apollo) hypothetical protein n=1 Tax=Parnassius apollo TaxID=110799 RepID=A0A8S3XZ72_PARAO|nr:unnamed protein product [Parnassius apollo]
MMEEISECLKQQRKLHYTGCLDITRNSNVYGHIEFSNAMPVLQLAARLPDFRFRMYRNNMVNSIIHRIENGVGEVERCLECPEYTSTNDLLEQLNRVLEEAATNIIKFLDIIQYTGYSNNLENALRQCGTDLDYKQQDLQKEEMVKIHQNLMRRINNASDTTLQSLGKITKDSITGTRKIVEMMLTEIKALAQSLKNLMYKPLKCPKHLNSLPSSCLCIAAKLELIAWMGTFRERNAFENFLPEGYKLKVKNHDMCVRTTTMMLEYRAFVYRAKINGSNESTPTHPFLRINVTNSVKETQVKQKTLTPIWNQVLKVHKMQCTNQSRLKTSPPTALVEVNHSDLSGKTELIGRFELTPIVDDRQDYEYAPKLKWYDMMKGAETTGQVLMSFQVLQVPEKLLKTTVYSPIEETFYESGVRDLESPEEIEPLPPHLIPKYSTYKVDIYWWGLRDVSVTRKPCVVLEIEDLALKSDIITDKKNNCNFPNGRISQTFEASLDEVHYPPLNIRLYDSSTFGRTLFFGTYVVKNPMKYFIQWLPKDEREASLKRASIMSSSFIEVGQSLFVKRSSPLTKESSESLMNAVMEGKHQVKPRKWRRLFSKKEPNEEEYTLLPMLTNKEKKEVVKEATPCEHKDWWMRYLYSQKECFGEDNVNAEDKISIYDSELELQPEFSKFKDWCSTLKLYNGNKTGIPEKDEQLYCGFLKAGIALYKWPPPATTVPVSSNGVELNCGMYEFSCSLPEDYLLSVSVYDCDNELEDELIGSTNVDLEDRIYSKHRGRVGLSVEYNMYVEVGPSKWRDCIKPSAILEDLCQKNHIPAPIYPDTATVLVNGVEYRDNERDKVYGSPVERRENICLTLLRNWHTLPVCGYHLVPEHVETRTLYNPAKPGVETGKIHMWVDIFPLDPGLFIPCPIDITPRKIEDFELRVTVLNVNGLKFKEEQSEKKASEIYVRAWIGSVDQVQRTDVHFNYPGGVCNFNWRMVFNFQYQHAEGKLVTKEKGPFTEIEERIPPVLIVQVLDGDATCSDDFMGNELGSLHLNLNSMPRGVNLAQLCTLNTIEKTKKISMFAVRSVRAWWPLKLIDRNNGSDIPAGAIELDLSLLPKETAILMPCCVGRESPYSIIPPS